jgi:hypothetical protein
MKTNRILNNEESVLRSGDKIRRPFWIKNECLIVAYCSLERIYGLYTGTGDGNGSRFCWFDNQDDFELCIETDRTFLMSIPLKNMTAEFRNLRDLLVDLWKMDSQPH